MLQAHNRPAIWAWLGLLLVLALLATASWFALYHKFDDDLQLARQRGQQELKLVATFMANALQSGRYQDADTLLREWGEANPDVFQLQLIAANGFVIASYWRVGPHHGAYLMETPLSYSYRGQAHLRLGASTDKVYRQHNLLVAELVAVFGVFSTLMVILTYIALRNYRISMLLRKRSQEVIDIDKVMRANEARLRLALSAGNMGTFDWNILSGKIIWSEEHARLFGIPLSEFDGSYASFACRVYPDDLQRVEHTVDQARRDRHFYEAEFRIIWPDGSLHWMASRGNFFYDESGCAQRMAGLVMDISARKYAEEILHESEHRLRNLINSLFVYVAMMTPDGIVTETNLPPLKRAGLQLEDVLGKAFPDCFWWSYSSEVQARLWDAIKRAAAGESVRYDERARMLDQYIIVDLALTPMRNAQGEVTHIIPSGVDITERKLAEAALRQLTTQLEHRVAERTAELAEKNRELETFTYSVSHDLKAPLRGIDGYSRLLLADYAEQLDEQGQFFVQTIREATMQMGQLIDDLLAYSRLERRNMRSAPLVPLSLVERLVAERRTEIEARQVQIAVDIQCDAVYAEAEGLALALRNLLDNALKFTQTVDRPQIAIGASVSDAKCLLWICDNGPGFEMQYHDRIFEIFQRLHRAEEFPGTGIGLAIVRKAMQRMHGRVWAHSEVGHGATFFLELPTTELEYESTA